jgi:pimeloyl-ACP methyl ester carboxylesterase
VRHHRTGRRSGVRRAAGALALCGLLLAAPGARAAGSVQQVPTRDGVTTALYWSPVAGATTTVLLLPGGDGGFGRVDASGPSSRNFLVRSAALFEARGLNVAIFGRPSDRRALGFEERIGAAHVADVRGVLDHLRGLGAERVWLVGTSRGSISAAAAAIALPERVAGVVLSASVTRGRPGALTTQDLAALRAPVLVLHHALDACPTCAPQDVGVVVRSLTGAPVRKALLLTGGGPPTGDVCEAMHYHGFIGIEAAAVDAIAGWIARPVP